MEDMVIHAFVSLSKSQGQRQCGHRGACQAGHSTGLAAAKRLANGEGSHFPVTLISPLPQLLHVQKRPKSPCLGYIFGFVPLWLGLLITGASGTRCT